MTSEKTKSGAQWGKHESWRIMKNVLVISVAFMVFYTAFNGAVNLQSSIHNEAGLGMAPLAAMYGGVLFSSFFLPIVIIKWLDTKWTIPFCMVAFMPYIAAQLFPSFYTLVPAGILAGLGSAPLWCSMCTYIATVSEAHSKMSKVSADALLARHLGQFYMVFHINQVWGNIISSVVISTGGNKAAVTHMNATLIPELCGANFLPSADAGKALQEQPPQKIQTLAGIFLACMVGAIIIVAIGVDSPKRYKTDRNSKSNASGLALLAVTMKLLIEPNQLLLLVISIFIGLQQGFVTADVTVAFVSCAIGPGTVGYVMMAHGLADAFGCAVTGLLAKLIGRVRLICCAVCVNTALYVTMLSWRPHLEEEFVVYVIAIVAGVCNSVWLVQINAYYGSLFPGREEPAFATFRLFESIGFIITFSISPYLRTSSKVYLLFCTMVLGSIGYFIVEYRQRRVKQMYAVTKGTAKGCDNKAFNM
ncbi:UNC93-like protein [Pectinophora gossypiella]|uniref:UNC93-like protein n=1 Tax=Pectinophora gossypiella TaxID=13191 RepID=UPI00214F3230|nr:UNC93-like protein [Pectinophora gossypiella]XP_049873727.1 UNC93-like protein [Pectinophora gossypiella]XP_049873728.1 UNC93-like protein [Pectinophora gossypiella]XP_049873729.1 UNC93-like protein [Pectinophora gossypiella]XP_049873730.1 UNC93-like protein [Pectinophora gossypiella]XP_049873731.1 UNC93-like protein [Pectinophora gossypiella]XP_049873732.1 UNC93-like protein [Pectinophora gossypiella]XP_049873734.1 UNC93-like protein [Pectinophora gossypiella]